MDDTANSTMTASQASQFMREKFPPGQGDRQDPSRITQNDSKRQGSSRSDNEQQVEFRRIAFNADMIAHNNNNEGDTGVTDVIKALLPKDDKSKMQAFMSLQRTSLVPTFSMLADKAKRS